MAVKHGTAQTAYDDGKRHGMWEGLEMANKYATMCGNDDGHTKEERAGARMVGAMIRAALATLKNQIENSK